MNNLALLDENLRAGVALIEESAFVKEMMSSNKQRVLALYTEYLRYCYHYVSLSSSFTPLAARRLDTKHLHVRKWILEHSGEELGHELMALNDLKKLGVDTEMVKKEKAPIGVTGYVSFFHYKVAIDNPWCAFGVLYLLEGMATALAPKIAKNVASHMGDIKALSFFKEHGDLDVDHMREQQEVLTKADLTDADLADIARTILETAHMKRFMLDKLVESVKG